MSYESRRRESPPNTHEKKATHTGRNHQETAGGQRAAGGRQTRAGSLPHPRGQRGNIPALKESLRGRQEGRPQAAARIGERERAGKKSPPWRARVLSGGAWRWMWWEVWGRPAPSVRSSGIVGRCVAVGVIAWRFSMLKAMHTPDTARAVFGRIAPLCATSRRNRRC